MAMIPTICLKSVVSLGVPLEPQKGSLHNDLTRPVASGFLYKYPVTHQENSERIDYLYWLVTCKHLIEELAKEGFGEFRVQMNARHHQGRVAFRTPLQRDEGPDYFLHPSQDVCVMPIPWENIRGTNSNLFFFTANQSSMTRKIANCVGLSEGDEVFILGFPTGWQTGIHDYPVVRGGVVAQIQGWLNEEHDVFLVDGSGYPGNSGGPVVLKPQVASVEGTSIIRQGWLIGMVSGVKIDPNTGEKVDLVKIVPVDTIDETIEGAMKEDRFAARLIEKT